MEFGFTSQKVNIFPGPPPRGLRCSRAPVLWAWLLLPCQLLVGSSRLLCRWDLAARGTERPSLRSLPPGGSAAQSGKREARRVLSSVAACGSQWWGASPSLGAPSVHTSVSLLPASPDTGQSLGLDAFFPLGQHNQVSSILRGGHFHTI